MRINNFLLFFFQKYLLTNSLSKCFLLLFLLYSNVSAQNPIKLDYLCKLPNVLNENSGILIDLDGNVWMHNDSGNKPEIYQIDENCQIVRTIRVVGAENIDWEDITSDRKGRVFIGDFGNNLNDRENLAIYIIPDPSLADSNEIIADKILFTYSDQNDYPPVISERNFDMEAFFWYKDSLYLFSKNRTDPFDGYTKLYVLPDKAGKYVANFKDSLFLAYGNMELNWITAVDISQDDSKIALLSSNKMWILSDFQNDSFFKGTITAFLFSTMTQKEGLAFIDNDRLLISDERNFNIGGNLYIVDMFKALNKNKKLLRLKTKAISSVHNKQIAIFKLLFPHKN